ncbi:MAG TPA: flagellar biosynthesis anti-sigma factor FlgM [Terracidiphilus sp.]|jgi:negative regulator of flagellin synthesis FlgM|nr:flagellar biosynthesis anti-sigma factor FlgM [Terracidiphilus sp.]
MRIDLYNSAASQIGSEPNQKRVGAQNIAATESDSGGDRTTLTSGSGSVSALVSEAMHSPEIRQDKVQSLQQAISSGQYKLEPDKIAGAMIDEHA